MPNIHETIERLKDGDPSSAVLGRRFEVFIQDVLRSHPGEYGRERFAEVWLWQEWPDRESYGLGSDYGIDIVAQQTDAYGGGLCAIQCKFRSEGGEVSTQEVSNFLAAVGGAFSSSLLVATAPIAKKGMGKIRNAAPRCEVLHTAEMDGWVDDWASYLKAPQDFEIPPPPKHELFDFQWEAVNAVTKGLSENDRGQMILPCGTGKSFVALRIAEKLLEESGGRGVRVLYLVPNIALVGQTMREWSAQRSTPLQYLGVCSDSTAGRKASERVDIADDITGLAIPVTTDPVKIRKEITEPVADGVMQVIFSTYHSSPRIKEAMEAGAELDLIICDEAHRTTGIDKGTGKDKSEADIIGGKESYYQIVHHDRHIPAKRRLYMTATPRVFAERAKQDLAEGDDPDCYDMNDESIYGEEFYRMSFGEAVEAGHLTEYEVLVITASQEAYLQSIGGGSHELIFGEDSETSLNDAVKLAGCWDALASPKTTEISEWLPGQIHEKGGDPARSAIGFTNRVATSQFVADKWETVAKSIASKAADPDFKPVAVMQTGSDGQQIRTIGEIEYPDFSAGKRAESPFLHINVEHVDGTTPAAERVRCLHRLEQDRLTASDSAGGTADTCQIITNARVLSEGVNVPSLDAVLFLDPRSSQIDITQQVGRVMRRAPGKDKGYIVIPVVVPQDADPREQLEASDWSTVWQVVKALRSHDERLNYYINQPDAWAQNAPFSVRVARLGEPDGDPKKLQETYRQLHLELSHEIASKVVEICGDRQTYPTWGRRAAEVCAQIQTRVEHLTGEGGLCEEAFEKFLEGIRASVRGEVEVKAAQQMIAQHIVTIPVFDAMLGKNEFSQHNPVSKEIERLLAEFRAKGVYFNAETKPLTRAYQNMSEAFEGAVEGSARLDILRQIYDGFFNEAMRDEVKRLGIVYTPVEIVDFMVRSAEAICRKEFGRSISDENVHVLDPFCGTGTFLARLLEMKNDNGQYIIRDDDIDRKYLGEIHANTHSESSEGDGAEIHANELVLLAYYIAALKIEEAKHTRDVEASGSSGYEPFNGIVLTDTFLTPPEQSSFNDYMDENIQSRLRQDQIPMTIIFGNPPWSSGQKSAGDDNPNIEYEAIGDRIDATYGAKHREVTGKSRGGNASGNLYVKALRWATDRILPSKERGDHPSVIGFVHPNSLTDGTSLAGVRAMMREEFSSIYVVNLRGNAYKSGDEFRKEGDKIFGGGSRNGVQITFLVRNPSKDLSEPATLSYAQVPDRMSLQRKFEWLAETGDVTSSELGEVPVTPRHDWVNLSDGTYEKLLPVCDTDKNNESVAAFNHASGVKTNCDTYVYSFSRDALEEKILNLIDAYNEALDDVECDLLTVQAATQNTQLEAIKWTDTLKTSLKQGKKIEFEPQRIREVLYRPFTKLWLYEDDRILSSVSTVSKMFPRDDEVEAFEVTAGSNNSSTDSVMAVGGISDMNSIGPARGGGVSSQEYGDPNDQREQHDFPGTRDEPTDGSSSHQGFSTNQGDPQSDITRGGGDNPQQFSSQPHPTKQSSEFSRPEPSGTSAQPEPSKPAEPSPESHPPDGPVQHGDLRHPSHHPASRPALHGSRPTNPNNPQGDITRGGGSRSTQSRATILIMRDTQLPFTTFATRILPDLHITGRPTRNLPRTRKHGQHIAGTTS